MDFLSGLALILLTLVGYSSGVTVAGKNKIVKPLLLDVLIIVVLWVGAIITRNALGKWLAVLAWLLIGVLMGSIFTIGRRSIYQNTKNDSLSRQHMSGLRQLWERWKAFAAEMGNYQSRMLLAFFYLIVVAPFGIPMRLASDPLRIKPTNEITFWVDIPVADKSLDAARKQF